MRALRFKTNVSPFFQASWTRGCLGSQHSMLAGRQWFCMAMGSMPLLVITNSLICDNFQCGSGRNEGGKMLLKVALSGEAFDRIKVVL